MLLKQDTLTRSSRDHDRNQNRSEGLLPVTDGENLAAIPVSQASNLTIGIVIPSHRRADLLSRCLESILQSVPYPVPILVVDDGSPNHMISTCAKNFKPVKVIRLPVARGFAAAANAGIRQMNTDIIHVLNDDTIVTANWLEEIATTFQNPTVGAVAPLVYQLKDGQPSRTIDSAGDEYDCGGFARKRGHNRSISACDLWSTEVQAVSASSAFYRKSALDKVGLFPECFGAYFEDVDLSLRIRKAGYQIRFIPQSVVYHRCHSSYNQHHPKVIQLQSRNEEWLFWRHLPKDQRFSSFGRHFAVLILKSLKRIAEGTFIRFFMGRLEFFLRIYLKNNWQEA